MNSLGPGYNSWHPPKWSNRLPAIVATILIFTVTGLYLFLFVSALPTAWRNCGIGFPTAHLAELIVMTLRTSFERSILSFQEIFVWEPTFKIAATACILSAWKTGRPRVLFTAMCWFMAAFSLILILSLGEIGNEQNLRSDEIDLMTGSVVSALCCILAKFFWHQNVPGQA